MEANQQIEIDYCCVPALLTDFKISCLVTDHSANIVAVSQLNIKVKTNIGRSSEID